MECVVTLKPLDPGQYGQLKYASAFVDEHIDDILLDESLQQLTVIHHSPLGNDVIRERLERLVTRFSKGDFGFKENRIFEHSGAKPYSGDIMADLLAQKTIKVLEPGLFIFREPFSQLMRFMDHAFVQK
ncbi:hypothetical protein [Paenibacillus senegalensis]|uniref:hypothetical protein n=1 Tax=Paenibacillus senegalensis TaxID=1465766 RepID=UPI0002E9D153|nr:hypothetical protein [Paenibacillus senegalensis]